jgi:2-phosphosulfolactate phosphatase
MDVRVLELVEGAREARGLTVVIDVFRAFTLECYLFAQGAKAIYPIGSVDEARALKAAHPDWAVLWRARRLAG